MRVLRCECERDVCGDRGVFEDEGFGLARSERDLVEEDGGVGGEEEQRYCGEGTAGGEVF